MRKNCKIMYPKPHDNRIFCAHLSPKARGTLQWHGTQTPFDTETTAICLETLPAPSRYLFCFNFTCLCTDHPLGSNSYKRKYNPNCGLRKATISFHVSSSRERNQTVGPWWINLYAPVSECKAVLRLWERLHWKQSHCFSVLPSYRRAFSMKRELTNQPPVPK